MSDDIKLLELAARAAGLPWDQWVIDGDDSWNPLTDDGDALRLAVKLSLMVVCDDDPSGPKRYTLVETGDSKRPAHACEMHGDDPYAATRRAIVRTAAEIGKARHG